MTYPNRNRTGKTGTRVYAKREEEVLLDEHTSNSNSYEAGEASVGVSASIGHAKDFGKTKFEVACWVTVPCADTVEDRTAASREATSQVCTTLDRMREEVAERYFPNIEWDV